jgi:fatty acid desaturase
LPIASSTSWPPDWFAAFPILTTTYHFRLHHLAHHQFVNDPERDPDISQLHESEHWLDFPITHVEMLWALLKQVWIPNLFRTRLRAPATVRWATGTIRTPIPNGRAPYVRCVRASCSPSALRW